MLTLVLRSSWPSSTSSSIFCAATASEVVLGVQERTDIDSVVADERQQHISFRQFCGSTSYNHIPVHVFNSHHCQHTYLPCMATFLPRMIVNTTYFVLSHVDVYHQCEHSKLEFGRTTLIQNTRPRYVPIVQVTRRSRRHRRLNKMIGLEG